MSDSPRSEAPSSPAATRWFYSHDGAVIGPMPLASLKALWKAGELPPGTLAVREGREDWQPLSEVLGAVSVPSTPLPPAHSPTPPPLKTASAAPVARFKPAFVGARRALHLVLGWSLGCLSLGLFAFFIIGIVVNLKRRSTAPQEENKIVPVLADGLTKDASKLRLIKSESTLFADEKTKIEGERLEATKRPELMHRLSWEGRYLTIATASAGELLEEDAAKGLSRVRFRDKILKENLELWTLSSNLLPFDSGLAKTGDEEYAVKFRDVIARQAEREKWCGMTARIKPKTPVFADDDALWEVLDGEITTEARTSELTEAHRAILTDGESTGTVKSVKGPYCQWFKMETNLNGKPVELWVRDDYATFENPKPDPAVALESIKHAVERALRERFKDRIRKVEISEKEGGYSVRVNFTGRDSLTTNMTREAIEYDMAEGYHAIFKASDEILVASMWAYLPLTNKFGESKDGVVYQTELDAESARRIQWEMSHALPWSEIWKTERLHPIFKQ